MLTCVIPAANGRSEIQPAAAFAAWKSGLVTTSWRESTEGPPRRYYALTESGHLSLRAFRQAWQRFRDAVDAALNTHGGRS